MLAARTLAGLTKISIFDEKILLALAITPPSFASWFALWVAIYLHAVPIQMGHTPSLTRTIFDAWELVSGSWCVSWSPSLFFFIISSNHWVGMDADRQHRVPGDLIKGAGYPVLTSNGLIRQVGAVNWRLELSIYYSYKREQNPEGQGALRAAVGVPNTDVAPYTNPGVESRVKNNRPVQNGSI